ncbi:NUDIX hydrolase [Mesobacillus subterraneus]|uniref:NUDIX domain-containing protein n=1 Tax=Mesobacillus subterraneus TaxID=285983 RepID=A0A427TMI0_9BACI|nr:NUDIX hydrolase [Mesobacillus subterraneus]RSD25541.1 NUDIX domain-containing protein [Mesobacillus subterraneus]
MGWVSDLRKIVGNRPLILPGSVVLIFNKDGEVLLQHRTDGGWGLPGGIMELGESLEETARREVKEETGLDIGELQLEGVFSGSEYFLKVANGDELYSVTVVYSTQEYNGEIEMDENESIDLQFFNLNQLPEELTKSYQHYVNHYIVNRVKTAL